FGRIEDQSHHPRIDRRRVIDSSSPDAPPLPEAMKSITYPAAGRGPKVMRRSSVVDLTHDIRALTGRADFACRKTARASCSETSPSPIDHTDLAASHRR